MGIITAIMNFFARLFTGKSRITEEREEETDTLSIYRDEIRAVDFEKDEKKHCVKLINLFTNIIVLLKQSNEGAIAEQLSGPTQSITNMLERLRQENMGVERAKETFTKLYTSTREFVSKLPKDPEIQRLIK